MQKRCPINQFSFTKKGSAPSKGVEEKPFNEKYNIAFSKAANNLPLSEFVISEENPCMDYFRASSYKSP